MKASERQAIRALAVCSFLPGSFDKRLVRLWDEKLEREPRFVMTRKGSSYLWRLIWRYRRQISDEQLIATARKKNEASL